MKKIIPLDREENILEDVYSISINGDIINNKSGRKKSRIFSGLGYAYISLCTKNNKTVSLLIHRLLAKYFLPKTETDIKYNRNIVHFKDFDNTNITIENLQWVNQLELSLLNNIRDTKSKKIGDYVESVCKLLEKDYDVSEICDILGISLSKYGKILRKIEKKSIYKDICKKYKY